jgi:hypothetical protein
MICELDPIFVAKHFDELEEHWTLQDGIGNSHRVTFNKIMTMPMLTFGWDEFRDYYNIKMKPLISFTYLKNSVFQTKIFEGSATTNEYPSYHRLSTCITRDLTFHVIIPENSPIGAKFVSFIVFEFNYLKLLIIIYVSINFTNALLFHFFSFIL